MRRSVDWYFDFISPFAYFQHLALVGDHPEIEIRYHPVLLGALFVRNDHKGPAEIPSKRTMTYRFCAWYAARHGIPLRFPDVHPYRPVNVLRLALAAGVNADTVSRIFEYIWVEGKSPDRPERLEELSARLGVDDCMSAIGNQDIKDQLRQNTERAIELGAFGVPTAVVDGKLFWGHDQTPMLIEYLDNRGLFESGEYKRLESIRDGLAG